MSRTRDSTGGTIDNILTANNGATSSSTSTGSLIVNGGMGVSGAINSGGAHTSASFIANETISGSLSAGAFSYGTLGYTDVNIFESLTTTVNQYSQTILQNTNSGTAASADFIISNNNGTASTFYGDLGITSSGYNTPGQNIKNVANIVYLQAVSCDLAIGTVTSNAIHFVIGASATDTMTIATTGGIAMLANIASTTTGTGTLVVTGGVGISGAITAGSAITATAFISNIATGTPPFAVTSTTNVANLNASSLNGATFANPGAIGTTPSTGNFTTLASTGLTTANSLTVTTTSTHTGIATFTAAATFTVPSNVAASVPTIASAATIAPTTPIFFVSGTTSIATITAPAGLTNGGQVTIIPTGLFLTLVTGNIALASTVVVSKALIMTYVASTSKWYPSY